MPIKMGGQRLDYRGTAPFVDVVKEAAQATGVPLAQFMRDALVGHLVSLGGDRGELLGLSVQPRKRRRKEEVTS